MPCDAPPGADGRFEADFHRDIWYASLVHFIGPVARPVDLVEWVGDRRHVDLGVTAARGARLILWRFNGSGMIPEVLAETPFVRAM